MAQDETVLQWRRRGRPRITPRPCRRLSCGKERSPPRSKRVSLRRTLSDRPRSERFSRRRGVDGVRHDRKVKCGRILEACGGFSPWAATNDLEKETAFELWGQKLPKKQTGCEQLETAGEAWLFTWAGSEGKGRGGVSAI